MRYEFFDKYEQVVDPRQPLINAYRNNGVTFYVEPGFYNALKEVEANRLDKLGVLLEKVYEAIEKYRAIVFTADFEHPFIDLDGYVYKEITDIGDPLGIYLEETNTPSNYGD